jgi:hypothetical protein
MTAQSVTASIYSLRAEPESSSTELVMASKFVEPAQHLRERAQASQHAWVARHRYIRATGSRNKICIHLASSCDYHRGIQHLGALLRACGCSNVFERSVLGYQGPLLLGPQTGSEARVLAAHYA